MREPGPAQSTNKDAIAEWSESTNATNRRVDSDPLCEKVKIELLTLRNERQMLREEIGALKAANDSLLKAIVKIESKCEVLRKRATTAERLNVELQERIREQQRCSRHVSAAEAEGNVVGLQREDEEGMTTNAETPSSRIEYLDRSRVPPMTEEELYWLGL